MVVEGELVVRTVMPVGVEVLVAIILADEPLIVIEILLNINVYNFKARHSQ